MKAYYVKDYEEAGCPEFLIFSIGMTAVYHMTGGKVCDTGCYAFNNGKCPAYQKLVNPTNSSHKSIVNTETVKEEAKRLGISISQVRKMRRGVL